jgi:hypothetical protein
MIYGNAIVFLPKFASKQEHSLAMGLLKVVLDSANVDPSLPPILVYTTESDPQNRPSIEVFSSINSIVLYASTIANSGDVRPIPEYNQWREVVAVESAQDALGLLSSLAG